MDLGEHIFILYRDDPHEPPVVTEVEVVGKGPRSVTVEPIGAPAWTRLVVKDDQWWFTKSGAQAAMEKAHNDL